jgi:uncharacterized protein (TIGR03545 family)
MRKNFVFFVLIPLLLFLVIAWFFIDRWIESGLEFAGEAITGSCVEIDHLDLKLSPIAVRFERLQVASTTDSLANLFETGRVKYVMNFAQLLRGRTVIDSMEIKDLYLNTPRTTSGFLPGKRRDRLSGTFGRENFQAVMDELLQRVKGSTPLFDPALWRGKVNVDSLIRAQKFQTLTLVDSLRGLTATSTAEWDTTLKVVQEVGRKLEEMKSRLLAIRPAELKTVEDVTRAIATVDGARKSYAELNAAFSERYKSLSGKVEALSGAVATLDDAVKADVRQVLSLARLPDINTMGLAELLIGEKVITDAKKVAGYVDQARTLAARYSSPPLYEYPERLKGQDIPFPVTRGYPDLWIRQVRISGGAGSQSRNYLRLSGTVRNISSDQKIAGEPLGFALDGAQGDELRLHISGQIDRRTEVPSDRFAAHLSGLRVPAFQLGKADFLPAIAAAPLLAADVEVTLPGAFFTVQGDLRLRALTLSFATEPRNIGERLAREVLSGVTGLDAGFKLWRGGEGVNASFTTDLDNQFADGVRRVVGAELTKLQNQLKERVEKEVAGKRLEFERYYAAKRDEVQKQLEACKTLVEENKKMLEERRKELEARLEEVKKGAVDKVMDKILKKN